MAMRSRAEEVSQNTFGRERESTILHTREQEQPNSSGALSHSGEREGIILIQSRRPTLYREVALHHGVHVAAGTLVSTAHAH